MMINKFLLLASLLLLSLSLHAQRINSSISKVTFSLSNMRVNTVEGSFTGMKGEVNFQPSQLEEAKFRVCVDASTVNTGISKRDEHLLAEDWFDVANYPTICFESERVWKTASGYETKGRLRMRGVSKTVRIPFTFEQQTFVGKLIVKRLDYGVGEGTGGFMVGKEIEIVIRCVID